MIVKCTNVESTNNTLNHDIIPYVAGHGIKKLFDKVTIKCHVCTNKLSYGLGHTINLSVKSRISYNISCVDVRDEGGLMWTSRIVVFLCGTIIIFLKKYYN